MDAETITRNASYMAAVFFRQVGPEPEFRFVELDGSKLASIKCRTAILGEGFQLVLFVGIMDAKIVSAEYVAPSPEVDAVSWLQRLYALPDERMN